MKGNIGIRIADIFELDGLEQAKILAGAAGIENNITTVNVMEVPDIADWVRPGEFLLTTAYSIRNDINQLIYLIPKLKEKGVSGLAIKTQRYIDGVPQQVLQAADELEFPIIQLPAESSFGDLINTILTGVVTKQVNLLVQIDEFNNYLKDIMLRGGEFKEIAQVIQDVVQAPVAITESVFQDYVLLCPDDLRDDLKAIVETSFDYDRTRSFSFNEYRIEKVIDSVNGKDVERIMIPISSEDLFYGYVMIWDMEKSISQSTFFMIEASASLIALSESKKISIFESENKHRIEFIEQLLSPSEEEQQKAIEKANYFGFLKDRSYGVIQLRYGGSGDIQLTPNNAKIYKRFSSRLISTIKRLQKHHWRVHFIYGTKSDKAVFLLQFSPEMSEDKMREEMEEFCKQLHYYSRIEEIHNQIYMGIGRVFSDYRSLYKSYAQSERAIQKLMINPGDAFYLHFDDLGIYRVLSHESITDELIQMADEILQPIIEYDMHREAELLDTLMMYYRCGGNIKKVSENMYTHYNTIIYRLQRIKDIGKFDLNNSDTALTVHLALKVYEFLIK